MTWKIGKKFSPPSQKKHPAPKNYFFSNSISSTQIVIPWWTAGGVRALWVSEHPLWRTRYYELLFKNSDPTLKSTNLIPLNWNTKNKHYTQCTYSTNINIHMQIKGWGKVFILIKSWDANFMKPDVGNK